MNERAAVARWQRAAICERFLGDNKTAADCLRHIAYDVPKWLPLGAANQLRRVLIAAGRDEDAATVIEEEMRLVEDPARVTQLLAELGELLEHRLERPKDALRAYRKLAARLPDDAAAARACERVLAAGGDQAERKAALEELIARASAGADGGAGAAQDSVDRHRLELADIYAKSPVAGALERATRTLATVTTEDALPHAIVARMEIMARLGRLGDLEALMGELATDTTLDEKTKKAFSEEQAWLAGAAKGGPQAAVASLAARPSGDGSLLVDLARVGDAAGRRDVPALAQELAGLAARTTAPDLANAFIMRASLLNAATGNGDAARRLLGERLSDARCAWLGRELGVGAVARSKGEAAGASAGASEGMGEDALEERLSDLETLERTGQCATPPRRPRRCCSRRRSLGVLLVARRIALRMGDRLKEARLTVQVALHLQDGERRARLLGDAALSLEAGGAPAEDLLVAWQAVLAQDSTNTEAFGRVRAILLQAGQVGDAGEGAQRLPGAGGHPRPGRAARPTSRQISQQLDDRRAPSPITGPCLSWNQRNAAALLGLAQLETDGGNLEAALNHYGQLLDATRDPQQAYQLAMNQADLCRRQTNWPEARRSLELALRHKPDDAVAMEKLSQVYLEMGDVGAAVDGLVKLTGTLSEARDRVRIECEIAHIYRDKLEDAGAARTALMRALITIAWRSM